MLDRKDKVSLEIMDMSGRVLVAVAKDALHAYFTPAVFLAFVAPASYAQQDFTHLSRENGLRMERFLHAPDDGFHSSFKPYIQERLDDRFAMDSLTKVIYAYRYRKQSEFRGFIRKLRHESLIVVDTAGFRLSIDPLLHFQQGRDGVTDSVTYVNTRGFVLRGKIGNDLSFYSDFRENQAEFVKYLDDYVRKRQVVPGQGAVKTFKGNGFDYAMASGYVSYTPSEHFNFRFGHGKHFAGDGYRSLLLSDYAFNYPFFRITTNIWKLQYVNLYASFQNKDRENGSFAPHTYESGYRKKYGSFHYLSWNAVKRLQVSVFEGIIWQGADSSVRRGFDVNYLNPVIFFRPVEFSLGSPDNAIIGLNMKCSVTKKGYIYGQAVADDINLKRKDDLPINPPATKRRDFFQSKTGWQLGLRGFDVFSLPGFDVQAEYNTVRPYTYAHKTPQQSYTHFGEPLAHPLGANFREALVILDYAFRDLSLHLKINRAVYGEDSTASHHLGRDVFKSDFDSQYGYLSFGNTILQGVRTELLAVDLRLSYLVNPSTNLHLYAGFLDRTLTTETAEQKTSFVYFGLKTSLWNEYFDF